MAKIKFTKMQAAGNDFIVLDNKGGKLGQLIKDFSKFTQAVCPRKTAVGADGVLVLEGSSEGVFKMRIINPDGSEVTMCGNGARCAALYAFTRKWAKGDFLMETGAGMLKAFVAKDRIKLKMTDPEGLILNKTLKVGETNLNVHFLNTGVPHVVYFVENIDDYPVKEIGASIRYHDVFQPEGTNANFVKVIEEGKIKVRTYERGVEDETLACGTGSVASAIISGLAENVKAPVEVVTLSGEILKVYFSKSGDKISDVYLEGPAKIVFEGEVEYV